MASTSSSVNKTIATSGYSYNLVFTATFSTTDGLSVTARLTNSSQYSLTYNYDTSWNASNGASGSYRLGTITGGQTKTLFTSGSNFSSGSASVTFSFYGITYTISANIPSDATGGTLSADKSTLSLGDSVYFTVSGGSGVTYKINLVIGDTTISTGLAGSGSYTFTANTFIGCFGASGISKTVRAVLESYSSNTGSYVSSSNVYLTLEVGDYSKAFSYTRSEFYRVRATNGNLVAGTSSIKNVTTLTKKLSNDSATISSATFTGTYSDGYSGTASFTSTVTTSGNTVTITSLMNTVFPVPSNSTSTQYQMTGKLVYTDSRGNTNTVSFTNKFTILCYIPPKITSTEVARCDASGNLSASGTYCKATLKIEQSSSYTMEGAYVTDGSASYTLTSSDYLTFSAVVGGSYAKNSQYTVTFYYRTTAMKSYNSNLWLTISNILPTMQLPISLFDDTDQVAVSFGEMAQRYSDVSSDSVANFAKGLTLRATNSDGSVITKDAYDLLSLSGGGAKVYVQTNTTIPSGMQEGDILVVYNQ